MVRVATLTLWANVYTRFGSRNQRFTSWPFRSPTPMCSDLPAVVMSGRSR
jgi:hypothetical protein